MNKMIKDALILFAITLVAGLGLGFVYNVTSTARADQENKTMVNSYKSVMPDMDSYEDVTFNSGKVASYIKDKVSSTEKEKGIKTIKEFNAEIDKIVLAKDNSGKDVGYIITVTDSEAYGGSLQMTVGIKKDGTVNGISFLSLKETPGLGMKAKDDNFKNQFNNKKVDYFAYSKTSPKTDNEVQAISSATITSNAVTHGVNAAIYAFDFVTGGGK